MIGIIHAHVLTELGNGDKEARKDRRAIRSPAGKGLLPQVPVLPQVSASASLQSQLAQGPTFQGNS